ncbi:hypothetical protein Q4R71_11100, partial [Morganella morganii]
RLLSTVTDGVFLCNVFSVLLINSVHLKRGIFVRFRDLRHEQALILKIMNKSGRANRSKTRFILNFHNKNNSLKKLFIYIKI